MSKGRFNKYTTEPLDLAEEFAEFHRGDDKEIQIAFDYVTAHKFSGWIDFKFGNADLLSAYVSMYPSKRANKFDLSAEDFPLINLAAYQHCLMAHKLLRSASWCQSRIGASYREMTALAGSECQQLIRAGIRAHKEWPRGWGESPF